MDPARNFSRREESRDGGFTTAVIFQASILIMEGWIDKHGFL
jgi:hypothetical protein